MTADEDVALAFLNEYADAWLAGTSDSAWPFPIGLPIREYGYKVDTPVGRVNFRLERAHPDEVTFYAILGYNTEITTTRKVRR